MFKSSSSAEDLDAIMLLEDDSLERVHSQFQIPTAELLPSQPFAIPEDLDALLEEAEVEEDIYATVNMSLLETLVSPASYLLIDERNEWEVISEEVNKFRLSKIDNPIITPEYLTSQLIKDDKILLKILFLMLQLKIQTQEKNRIKSMLGVFDDLVRLTAEVEGKDENDRANLSLFKKYRKAVKDASVENKEARLAELAEIEHQILRILFQLERVINAVPLFIPNHWVRNFLNLRELVSQQPAPATEEHQRYLALMQEYEDFSERARAEVQQKLTELETNGLAGKALEFERKQLLAIKASIRPIEINRLCLVVRLIGGANHPFLEIYDIKSEIRVGLRTALIAEQMLDKPAKVGCENTSSQHARLRIMQKLHGSEFITQQYLFKALGLVDSVMRSDTLFSRYATDLSQNNAYFAIEVCEFIQGMNLEARLLGMHAANFANIRFRSEITLDLAKKYIEQTEALSLDVQQKSEFLNVLILKDSLEMLLFIVSHIRKFVSLSIVPTDLKPSNLFVNDDGQRIILGDTKALLGPFRVIDSQGKEYPAELDAIKISPYFVETSPSHASGPHTLLQVLQQTIFSTFYHLLMGQIPPNKFNSASIDWDRALENIHVRFSTDRFVDFRRQLQELFKSWDLQQGGSSFKEQIIEPPELKNSSGFFRRNSKAQKAEEIQQKIEESVQDYNQGLINSGFEALTRMLKQTNMLVKQFLESIEEPQLQSAGRLGRSKSASSE